MLSSWGRITQGTRCWKYSDRSTLKEKVP